MTETLLPFPEECFTAEALQRYVQLTQTSEALLCSARLFDQFLRNRTFSFLPASIEQNGVLLFQMLDLCCFLREQHSGAEYRKVMDQHARVYWTVESFYRDS